jgi:hypothetical protein
VIVDFGADGPAPSVECRWDEGPDRRRMTFTLVRSRSAVCGSDYEVEVSWVDVGRVECLMRITTRAMHGGAALERCVRALASVVGGLRTQWSTGPGI